MKWSSNNKKYILVLLVIVLFLLLGKILEDSKDNRLKSMRVVLIAKVLKDDVFQFFYLEGNEKDFQIRKSIKTIVSGSEDFQKIEFVLPSIVNLNRIRLDIGENSEQGPVEIKEIRFIKEDEKIVFDKKEFNRLFSPNKHIVVNKENSFLGQIGKSGERTFYDPFFVSIDDSKEIDLTRTNYLTHYPFYVSGFVCFVVFLFAYYNLGKISISSKHVFVAVFFLALTLPYIQHKIEFTPQLENLEKRELAKKPNFILDKKFARAFENYFDDNFGFRNHLVNWGGSYKTKFFQSSVHPELVMFGRDRWLFYNRMQGRIYRSYSKTSLLTKDEINRVVLKWQSNKDKYESEGRKYFLGFWPNKATIYEEYLPYAMKMQIRDTISRVDQLINRTKKSDIEVQLTDVRQTLMDNKKNKSGGQMYYKFDSHWNDYGAFLAYQTFFRKNKELGIKPKNLDDFNVEWKNHAWGELIQMLGVRNKGYFVEKKPVFTLKKNKDQIEYLPIDGFPKLTVITKNEYCGNKLRALIFRDSFTNSLIPFFSLHFHEVYYIWGRHEEYVEQLQPDIIIEGFVEREMGENIP